MNLNSKKIYIATWVGIFANLFLAIIKGVGGVISGSSALIADSLHSASDIVSSVVILFAVRISNNPPDKEHHYGQGYAEYIHSIIFYLQLEYLINLQIKNILMVMVKLKTLLLSSLRYY